MTTDWTIEQLERENTRLEIELMMSKLPPKASFWDISRMAPIIGMLVVFVFFLGVVAGIFIVSWFG